MIAGNTTASTRSEADEGASVANSVADFLPQVLIAEMLNCSPSSVSRWVRGESVPGAAARNRLAVLLEVCETVHDPATPSVVRAWFVAMNPNFNYDRPKNRFIAGELSSVVDAAREFRTTTAKLKREDQRLRTNG